MSRLRFLSLGRILGRDTYNNKQVNNQKDLMHPAGRPPQKHQIDDYDFDFRPEFRSREAIQ